MGYLEAIKIFDEHLWSPEHQEMRTDPQVQLNALGLLWRLATRGQGETNRGRWKAVLDACRGVTLPATDDGDAAPAQHSDLLLDVCLVRAFCVGSAKNVKPLERFVATTNSHAKHLMLSAGDDQDRQERASAYETICRNIAELYREDGKPEAALTRQKQAKTELATLRAQWKACGGSEEQRGILLEAIEGPVVCGEPERNYDQLFVS